MVTPNLPRAAKFTLSGGGCGGGTPFFRSLGRIFFGEESKIFGFAWGGELTLDDTMKMYPKYGQITVFTKYLNLAYTL